MRFVTGVLILAALCVARADFIGEWNRAVLNVVKAEKTPPPQVAYNLAFMHAAMFDALNPSEDYPFTCYNTAHEQLVGYSGPAAAAKAGFEAAIRAHPTKKAVFKELYDQQLSAIPDGKAKSDGIRYGQMVITGLNALRKNDGSQNPVCYTYGTAIGSYQASPVPTPSGCEQFGAPPALPHWGGVVPWGIGTAQHIAAPFELNSAEYAVDFNQVKVHGKSTNTNEQEKFIARFWADGGGTVTPPGHWNVIALQFAESQVDWRPIDTARLLALLNIALADAGISAWKAKYTYNTWRPITAIRNAAYDGNDATDADLTWRSLLPTPNHPDYVSGHSTFSGAAAEVLTTIFGDHIEFTTASDDVFVNGVPATRTLSSFYAAADEAGISRIYGGIHTDKANTAGLAAGKAIGHTVVTQYLTPSAN